MSSGYLTLFPGGQTAPLDPSHSPAAVDLSPGFGTGSKRNSGSVPLQQVQIAMRPGLHYGFESPGYLFVVSFFIDGGSSVSYI